MNTKIITTEDAMILNRLGLILLDLKTLEEYIKNRIDQPSDKINTTIEDIKSNLKIINDLVEISYDLDPDVIQTLDDKNKKKLLRKSVDLNSMLSLNYDLNEYFDLTDDEIKELLKEEE